jgi:hypothetical protein
MSMEWSEADDDEKDREYLIAIGQEDTFHCMPKGDREQLRYLRVIHYDPADDFEFTSTFDSFWVSRVSKHLGTITEDESERIDRLIELEYVDIYGTIENQNKRRQQLGLPKRKREKKELSMAPEAMRKRIYRDKYIPKSSLERVAKKQAAAAERKRSRQKKIILLTAADKLRIDQENLDRKRLQSKARSKRYRESKRNSQEGGVSNPVLFDDDLGEIPLAHS